jgi:hypothetical protein
MMIPIPQEGIYKGVEQLAQAAQVPGIEANHTTAAGERQSFEPRGFLP